VTITTPIDATFAFASVMRAVSASRPNVATD
jgi:hypothetical protein